MAKAKSDKLTLKHIIGYGAGDCGGCFGLYMVSMYMARFLQVNLGVNAALLAIETYLVEPIDKHEEIQIVLKRYLEKPILYCYKKSQCGRL